MAAGLQTQKTMVCMCERSEMLANHKKHSYAECTRYI